MKILFSLVALWLCGVSAFAAPADCTQGTRNVVYTGSPVPVYLSSTWTEVAFPEDLRAILPNEPDGLDYHQSDFPSRLFFRATDPLYHGTAILEGVDGKTYTLNLLARDTCPDLVVGIEDNTPLAAPSNGQSVMAHGHEKTLLEFMIEGTTPPGYSVNEVPGPLAKRLVFTAGLGTIDFYLDKIYHGYNYTGFVLLAVNRGRTPVRVDIQGMDFSGSQILKTFGRIHQITMEPWDFRLGPAPEFAVDAAHPTNEGIIYIVSFNRRGLGGE